LSSPEWSSLFSVIIDSPSHVPSDFVPFSTNSQHSEERRAQAYIKLYLDAVRRLKAGQYWVFITEKGHLGVAEYWPRNTIGSPITGKYYTYVISGCNMSILVEPAWKQPREGIIQGTTHRSVYLHSYMYGKAIDELENGDLSLVTLALR
jgi:hypothetical protein